MNDPKRKLELDFKSLSSLVIVLDGEKQILESKIQDLERKLEIEKEALKDGSYYFNKDDVNGEAGYICRKALLEIEGVK